MSDPWVKSDINGLIRRAVSLTVTFVLLIVWSLLPASQLYAQPTTDDGELSAEVSSEEVPESAGRLDSDVLERIDDYQQLLADLQRQMGNDDLSLLEPLGALSDAYLSTGNYREAEIHLNQQVQLQRMVLGLYHANQIPALESLLTIHALRRDWTELSDSLTHLGWLYSRTDMPTEERLQGLRSLRGWLLLLLSQDIRERESIHLLAYQSLTQQIWETALTLYDAEDEALMPWLYDLANADLMIALTIMTNPLTGQDIIARTEGIRDQGLRPGQPISSIADLEIAYGARVNTVYERSFRSHMQKQFQHLSEIRAFYSQAGNREAEAIMLMHLGDSVLTRQQFESRPGSIAGPRRGRAAPGTAVSYYRDAYETFMEAGIDESTFSSYFGCPALLPINDLITSLDQLPRCPQRAEDEYLELPGAQLIGRAIPGISAAPMMDVVPVNMDTMKGVTMQFNIARNGHATHIETLEVSGEDTAGARSTARRMMSDLQFRPALEKGNPVNIDRVRMHFQLP